MTVVIGGLLGALLNWRIQANLKQREAAQALQKTRGDLALASYKDFLDRRQEVIKNLNDLIGSCTSASYDLLLITGPDFDPSKFSKRGEPQRQEIIGRFNVVANEWRSKRDSLGAMISYYHEGNSNIMTSWGKVKDSLTAYMHCADMTYRDFTQTALVKDPSNQCIEEKKSFDKELAEFTNSLEKTRMYLWKEFTQ